MKSDMTEHIPAPSGVTVSTGGKNSLTVKGPKGELNRLFFDPKINITASANTITIQARNGSRREKKRAHTYSAHIKNMIVGVQEPHEYLLKICSGHFPMNVQATPTQFSIKNFLGEKIPRTVTIPKGVTVKVDADKITIQSPDLELAGQMAGRLEQLTRITNKDPRVFQDGVYITRKPD